MTLMEGVMVNFCLPDDFFNEGEIKRLKQLLDTPDTQSFENSIYLIMVAAMQEYKQMILGLGLPTNAALVREYRLFYLIKTLFAGRIPSELEVSNLFKIPETSCKTLICNTVNRFRFDLDSEIRGSLIAILKEAEEKQDGVYFHVYIECSVLRDELDRVLLKLNHDYRHVTKVPREPCLYAIPSDSFHALTRYFKIEAFAPVA